MCRHLLRNLGPTAEGISFFGRFCLWSYSSSKFKSNGLVYLTIHYILNSIGVDRERTIDRHVMCRHRLWYLRPTAEGISLFGRFCLRCDLSSKFKSLGLERFTVNYIFQRITIRGELCGEADVPVHYDGSGIVGIAVRP